MLWQTIHAAAPETPSAPTVHALLPSTLFEGMPDPVGLVGPVGLILERKLASDRKTGTGTF